MRAEVCTFSGFHIGPTVGITHVKADGRVNRYFNKKCKVYTSFKKNPGAVRWTMLGRIKKASVNKVKTTKVTIKVEKKPIRSEYVVDSILKTDPNTVSSTQKVVVQKEKQIAEKLKSKLQSFREKLAMAKEK